MPDSSLIDSQRPLLDVRDLSVWLGRGRRRREILGGVSLQVNTGEIVGLIGETGSGKTTLARTILGLHPAQRGSAAVLGTDVTGLSGGALRAFRRTGSVQYVFQDPLQSLDPDLPVRFSVGEGLAVRGGLDQGEIDARVDAALALVGLPTGLGDRLPAEISGGQRQRVAIARAMVLQPELLVCDEPVSALDAANRIRVLELLGALRASRALGLLFISHDLGSIAGITDRVVVLYRGAVVESGSTDQILNDPRHPYTQLLVGSAPSLTAGSVDRAERQALRDILGASE